MITDVYIKNFKSIQNNTIGLSALNVITGINSSGKSTLLQSILLLKQVSPNKKSLSLNGNFTELGTVNDILHQFYLENKIETTFTIDGQSSFTVTISDVEKHLKFDKAPIIYSGSKKLINSLLKRIKYLSAERMGPEFSYCLNNNPHDLGKKGESTVSYIYDNRNKSLSIKSLIHENAKKAEGIKDSLLLNINEWMKEISPEIKLEFESNSKVRASSMSASYYSSVLFESVTPKNFGFGISYCLPIITLILSAKKNDILLIENPEAHIHPTGQTRLGYLCAIAANAGIQLVIETHSDHFFNGIRLAVKEKKISTESLCVYYFDKKLQGEQSSQSLLTIIDKIELSADGKIEKAPLGFFDEWQNSLFKLL